VQVMSLWELNKQSEAEPIRTEFSGRRRPLLWMAFRLGFLTVLTLGFYRFWMKTRLRRWYWSAWRPGGHPFEYVGDPWEKLLGFLIAVVFLAFYIGIVNLLLMFASFSLFNGNFAAYLLSFLGVIPLWFYARYRARRYVLARTRWRGIRFGLEPGAWGFAARALWHWFLTIITLGLLWPRKAFYLEKYITDRTFYGSQRLHQGGRWTALFWSWFHVWISIAILAAVFVALTYATTQTLGNLEAAFDAGGDIETSETDAWLILWDVLPILVVVTPIWCLVALVKYKVKRVRYLTSHKTAGQAELSIAPRFWKVTGIYFWGYTLAGLVATLILTPVALATAVILEADGIPAADIERMTLETLPQPVLIALAIGAYFLLFLTWSAMMHAFIRFPMMRHFASTLTIKNLDTLDDVPPRARDEFGEAEGFAEALDVGAAI